MYKHLKMRVYCMCFWQKKNGKTDLSAENVAIRIIVKARNRAQGGVQNVNRKNQLRLIPYFTDVIYLSLKLFNWHQQYAVSQKHLPMN